MNAAPEPLALVGSVVAGRWRLERLLGVGAMSAVFEARHVLIGRRAALKILRPELLGRPYLRAWFLREARAVNWVNHVNIAEVYDLGESNDGQVFLVMELLQGERLADRLARGPLDLAVALDVVEQVAAALARAHDLGVVHRDLKPEHVFLLERGGRRDFVKLIDFGFARHARELDLAAGDAVLGTPGYIAPEVLEGREAGPAADLYALGVVFFEMVAGRPPFLAADPATLCDLHRTQPAPAAGAVAPGVPPEVSAVVARLLEKDPARRYGDAYRLLEDCRTLVRQRRACLDPNAVLVPPLSDAGAARVTQAAARWALVTALLGRMAAAAYPGGGAPREARRRAEGMWGVLSRLCQVEGELETAEAILGNARARAREASDAVALQIAELSRLASRMGRRVEGGRDEIARLASERRETGRRLRSLRQQVREQEKTGSDAVLAELLQAAAVAAARKQIVADAIAKVEAKIGRWLAEAERASQLAGRLREQLRAQNRRLEQELARQEARVAELYSERALHLATLAEAESWLREHLGRRRECASLMEELRRLDREEGTGAVPASTAGAGDRG